MGHKLWRAARTGIRRVAMDFRRTDALVLAVHDGMIPLLARGGVAPDAIRVLRNPVSPWRAARVQAEANRTVFFVGRLETDKGVDVLARAARKAGSDLCVIGDGPLRESLEAAHPEARFLGWRNRADIARLVGDCRLFVLPSRWRETFGLVALEAALSGVPVVTSRHALITGEIEAIGAGISCDPSDEDGLAAIIRELMLDDARIAGMSRSGFTQAGQLALDADGWVQGLIGLYREQIGRSAQSSERRTPLPALAHARLPAGASPP
jgi:glycosyltransferase involved in cell wall biosynthesis